jgi:hypothetical protein
MNSPAPRLGCHEDEGSRHFSRNKSAKLHEETIHGNVNTKIFLYENIETYVELLTAEGAIKVNPNWQNLPGPFPGALDQCFSIFLPWKNP